MIYRLNIPEKLRFFSVGHGNLTRDGGPIKNHERRMRFMVLSWFRYIYTYPNFHRGVWDEICLISVCSVDELNRNIMK